MPLLARIGIHGFQQQVLRKQQHHRPRPSAGCSGERHVHVVFNARDVGDALDPFGATTKDIEVIELLKRILVGLIAPHVLHDRQYRDRRLKRFRQSRRQQRCRRPILCRDHADFLRSPRVTIRHRRTRILGTIGNLPHAKFRDHQQQRGGQALSEQHLNAVAL